MATNRFDLAAEDLALIYKLRWEIENFFGWWKQHLKVYHLIARSEYLNKKANGMLTSRFPSTKSPITQIIPKHSFGSSHAFS